MKTPTSIRAAGLAAALGIIIAALPCAADTLTVTSTADDGSAGTLRAVLAQAVDGDTINFAVTTPATIVLAQGELALDRNLTITGPGRDLLIVDGNNASRVFWIEYENVVSISGLTIANGHSDSWGGGIASAGSLTLTDCAVRDCWARTGGGALSVIYGSLSITGCTFTGNSSSVCEDYHGGGALLWIAHGMGCSLVIDKCLFANNSAPFGGGISILLSGGTEYPTQATVTVTGSTISDNSCAVSDSGYGGGMAVQISGEGPGTCSATVTVDDCVLSENTILNHWSGSGGAISQTAQYADSTLIVSNSTISGNSLPTGGFGGGIAYSNNCPEGSYNSSLTVENSTFSDNRIETTSYQYAFGGALAAIGICEEPIAVNIRNSKFTDNQVGDDGFGGGAIWNVGMAMTILDSTLSGNSAPSGGAVFNGFPLGVPGIVSTLNVGGCVLSGNSAGLILYGGFASGGGAIASVAWGNNFSMTIEDSILTGNSSPMGGAISSFTSSHVEDEGGPVIELPGSSTTVVRNSTLSGNVAESDGIIALGGGIAYLALGAEGLCHADLTLENSTLNGNSAVGTGSDAGGGAICAIGRVQSTLTLRNSTLSGNTVTSDTYEIFGGGSGGAIFCRSSHDMLKVDLDNCTLSGNVISSNVGSAIFNDGCFMRLKNTILNGSPGDTKPVLCGDFAYGGAIDSFGNNLISDDDGGGFLTEAGDLTGTDPLLGPLADNGGPTWTHALLAGSPAIDAASSTDIAGNTVATDQRGVTRPQGPGHDIGAFERQVGASVYAALVQPPINADGTSVFSAKRGVVPVKFTLTVDGTPTCDLPPATIAVSRIGGVTSGAIGGQSYTMAADQGPDFRIGGCQYIYNLPVRSLDSGSYRVDILIDGEVAGSAVFLLQ